MYCCKKTKSSSAVVIMSFSTLKNFFLSHVISKMHTPAGAESCDDATPLAVSASCKGEGAAPAAPWESLLITGRNR